MTDLLIKAGMFFFDVLVPIFVKNQDTQAKMRASFDEFVKTAQLNAKASVNERDSYQSQVDELEQQAKDRDSAPGTGH